MRLFDRPRWQTAGPQETDSVANIKSAEKRAKQAVRRRAHNMAARSKLRSSIKKVLNALGAGNKAEAAAALKAAQPEMARGVARGVLHKNTVARKLSRLTRRVATL